jgi:hypothetical protein
MKTRIAAGAGLLLTLGTAMAGTLLYGHGRDAVVQPEVAATAITAATQVTPEMLAMWRAEARSTDYIAPKVPL